MVQTDLGIGQLGGLMGQAIPGKPTHALLVIAHMGIPNALDIERPNKHTYIFRIVFHHIGAFSRREKERPERSESHIPTSILYNKMAIL